MKPLRSHPLAVLGVCVCLIDGNNSAQALDDSELLSAAQVDRLAGFTGTVQFTLERSSIERPAEASQANDAGVIRQVWTVTIADRQLRGHVAWPGRPDSAPLHFGVTAHESWLVLNAELFVFDNGTWENADTTPAMLLRNLLTQTRSEISLLFGPVAPANEVTDLVMFDRSPEKPGVVLRMGDKVKRIQWTGLPGNELRLESVSSDDGTDSMQIRYAGFAKQATIDVPTGVETIWQPASGRSSRVVYAGISLTPLLRDDAGLKAAIDLPAPQDDVGRHVHAIHRHTANGASVEAWPPAD